MRPTQAVLPALLLLALPANGDNSTADRLTLRAEAFNLAHHANRAAPVSTFGLPLGDIRNVEPARQFQAALRLRF